jgi:hypothetical protein
MLAIFLSVEHWRNWIGGSETIIYTDNKNLLGRTWNYNKKTERWKATLNEFNIKYVYIEGKNNVIADELSRSSPDKDIKICNISNDLKQSDRYILTNLHGISI